MNVVFLKIKKFRIFILKTLITNSEMKELFRRNIAYQRNMLFYFFILLFFRVDLKKIMSLFHLKVNLLYYYMIYKIKLKIYVFF